MEQDFLCLSYIFLHALTSNIRIYKAFWIKNQISKCSKKNIFIMKNETISKRSLIGLIFIKGTAPEIAEKNQTRPNPVIHPG